MVYSLSDQFTASNVLAEDDIIQGYVSVRGSKTVFNDQSNKLPDTPNEYYASKSNLKKVRKKLKKRNFEIIAESDLGFAVEGSVFAFENLADARIRTRECLLHSELDRTKYVTHLDIEGIGQSKTLGVGYPPPNDELNAGDFRNLIDGILIQRPQVRLGIYPSPIPPRVSKYHLNVPDDIALGCSALEAHANGILGDGVRVAMPDSGHYRHPFFIAHQYKIASPSTVVHDTKPDQDPVGHGSGVSANLFAIAPHAELIPIRISNNSGKFVGALSGFMKAKALPNKPHIISCSWGWDRPFPKQVNASQESEAPQYEGPDEFEKAVALEILDAIQTRGIVVIFAGGNGQFSIEPQIPGVISAGGVYLSQDLGLEASNYSSGYQSPWYKGVIVPTVCGLVGQRPRAEYIMLPVPPGSELDLSAGISIVENIVNQENQFNDLTDGWALFSGTSASAPQVAGAAALILSKYPGLSPADVKMALESSATDISTGSNHQNFNNFAKRNERDTATGYGLMHVYRSILEASNIYSTKVSEIEKKKNIQIPLVFREDPVPLNIFDDDDRLDWYEMSGSFKSLAKSVSAIVPKEKISPHPTRSAHFILDLQEIYETKLNICPGLFPKSRKQPWVSAGSAFLVHQRLMLTAFHCLRPKVNPADPKTTFEIIESGDYDLSDMKFVFNYRMTSRDEANGTYHKNEIYSGQQVIAYEYDPVAKNPDWALVELSQDVTIAPPLKLVTNKQDLREATEKDEEVRLLGYPEGTPIKAVTDGVVVGYPFRDSTIFSTNLDAFNGNSGSPVFDNTGKVVGVLFGGGQYDYIRTRSGCNTVKPIPTSDIGNKGEFVQRLDNIIRHIADYSG